MWLVNIICKISHYSSKDTSQYSHPNRRTGYIYSIVYWSYKIRGSRILSKDKDLNLQHNWQKYWERASGLAKAIILLEYGTYLGILS